METFFIAILLAIPVLAMFAFIMFFQEWLAKQRHDRRLEIHHALHSHTADQNGNYRAYFDPRTGTFFVPPPGNPGYAPQIILHNGQPKPVKEDRTIAINPPRAVPVDNQPPDRADQVDDQVDDQAAATAYQVDDQPPAALPDPGERRLKVGELHVPGRDINGNIAVLRELWQEGRGKIESIKAVANCASTSSATYKTYSVVWDKFEETPGAPPAPVGSM